MAIADAKEGQTFRIGRKKLTVGPRCTTTSKGQWMCGTCGETLQTRTDAADHVERSPKVGHVLLWDCKAHGPEVP